MDGFPQDPVRGIQVTMMLADYVDASKGSLTIVGGGANITGPNAPHSLALSFLVPSHLADQQHTFRLELIDMDGNGVGVTTTAHQPLVVEGQFAVEATEDALDGQTFPCSVGINLGALGLPPHQTYEWRLMVDGEADEDWRLVFHTIPPVQGQQRRAA
jgi:hypothetical protein